MIDSVGMYRFDTVMVSDLAFIVLWGDAFLVRSDNQAESAIDD